MRYVWILAFYTIFYMASIWTFLAIFLLLGGKIGHDLTIQTSNPKAIQDAVLLSLFAASFLGMWDAERIKKQRDKEHWHNRGQRP